MEVGKATDAVGIVAGEQWGQECEALLMEGINEANVCRTQQVQIDELTTVGRNGEVLPSVEAFMLGVVDTHDYVFDADAELTFFVEAGLIRDAHALFKLELIASANAIRSLMHVEI